MLKFFVYNDILYLNMYKNIVQNIVHMYKNIYNTLVIDGILDFPRYEIILSDHRRLYSVR